MYGDIETVCISFLLRHSRPRKPKGSVSHSSVSHDTKMVYDTRECWTWEEKGIVVFFAKLDTDHLAIRVFSWIWFPGLWTHSCCHTFHLQKEWNSKQTLSRMLSVSQLCRFCELGRLLKACSWYQLKLNALQTGRERLKERADFSYRSNAVYVAQ